MTRTADVVVAGLGAMGSAAARALALRGLRVVGLDRFRPPHALGSSHGLSRIIREAYFEHPAYVPLVQRAYTLWRELEAESGRPLLRTTGGLMIGRPEGVLVEGARRSARTHGLPHEELPADEVRRRFPGFAPDAAAIGLFEPRAGVLFPEACVQAALEGAARAGAELRRDEEMTGWTAEGDTVRVTSARESWSAAHLVLAMGAWLPRLAPELPLAVERQVMFWFAPREPALFTPDACPIALWEFGAGRLFYTLPDFGDGLKAAIHHDGEATDPDRVRREPTAEDEADIRAPVARYLPAAAGSVRDARVCLYTNTPDQHFLLDAHPRHARVLMVSPCSGHGFKFASAIGEVVADLVAGGRARFDLAPFALARLADRPAGG